MSDSSNQNPTAENQGQPVANSSQPQAGNLQVPKSNQQTDSAKPSSETMPEKQVVQEPPKTNVSTPPVENVKAAVPPTWSKKEKPETKEKSGSSVSTIKEPIFKKLFPLLGIIILAVGLYFAVTKFALPFLENRSQGTESKVKITLNYWGLWESDEIIKPLIEEYQKNNPNITINYVQQSYKDYRERLQSALARGEEIDLFRYHITWLPMLTKDLAPAPDTVAQNINLSGNYYPSAVDNLKINGKIYGVPLMFDSLSLFYNTKIFKTAGKTPPETWEELRRTALDLTVKDDIGRIQIAGVALGTTNNIDHFSDILGLMLLQNGADLSKPTGVLAEDALRFYTIFTVSDKVWDETLPASTQAFADEKLAMLFAPSWRAFDIRNINPNLEFRTVPVPQLPDTKIAWATFWSEGVAANSKNQQAAWDFLNFLSSKESLTAFYTNASKVRDFGEPYPRKDMASDLEGDPIVGSFIKQASYAQTWYLCSATHDNGINDKIINYYKDAVNETLQTQNVSQALETAAQGVAQVLSQYQIK